MRPAVSDGLLGDIKLNGPLMPILALALLGQLDDSGAVKRALLLLLLFILPLFVGTGGGPMGAIAIAAAVRPGL